VRHFILGIPTEIRTPVQFRKVENKPVKRAKSRRRNGETPLGWQEFKLPDLPRIFFAENLKELKNFDTKNFSDRFALSVFVNSKEWIVQLKRNLTTVASLI
jgi:hypothetical protein